MSNAVGARLDRIRKLLAKNTLAAYIIPSADAHQSEYTAPCDKRRDFISGFTGSAGTAVVTPNEALLWTDGRYFLQAERELDAAHWTLMKQDVEGVPTMTEWLAANVPAAGRVGFDPFLVSLAQHEAYTTALEPKGIALAPVTGNLVDAIWPQAGQLTVCGAAEPEARPAFPAGTIKVHPLQFAGESVSSKLATLRAEMAKVDAYAVVVSALDEVAWLYNLRGSDIDFNPVFMSYAVVTADDATLFANSGQFAADVAAHLAEASVSVRPYADAVPALEALSATCAARTAPAASKVWTNAKTTTVAVDAALRSKLPGAKAILTTATSITLAKAIKNDAELAGMKSAHIKDAVAVCRFFAWLESQLPSLPKATDSSAAIAASPLTEFTVAEKLEALRREEATCVGLSFDTISSIGPNGAVIHYKPDETTSSPLTTGQVFLLDSGGQYLDGTTDITRTVYLARPGAASEVGDAATDGAPSRFQRRANTRVLQGHISLAAQLFPPRTMGPALDTLARQFLWKDGLNFLHGTGHGVGSYLNVHEGPQGIAMMNRGGSICTTPIVPGMVLSNEPGYYHDGEFGIRIENLVFCLPRPAAHSDKYYGFENLTLVPLDRQLIDIELLSADEVAYVDAYHAQCKAVVGPLLTGDAAAAAWLEKNTKPLRG
jgi:Xaa-Pro aminopeptidase